MGTWQEREMQEQAQHEAYDRAHGTFSTPKEFSPEYLAKAIQDKAQYEAGGSASIVKPQDIIKASESILGEGTMPSSLKSAFLGGMPVSPGTASGALTLISKPIASFVNPQEALASTKRNPVLSGVEAIGNVALFGSPFTSIGKSVLKTAITNPKTTAIVGGTALFTKGLADTSPKVTTALLNAPKSAVTFTSNVGNAIENPSVSSIGKILKESPLISGTLGILGASLLGSKFVNTFATWQNTNALKNNTEKPTESFAKAPKTNESASSAPTINYFITGQPEPGPIDKKPSKPRKKAKKKAKPKPKKKKAKKKTIKRRKKSKR